MKTFSLSHPRTLQSPQLCQDDEAGPAPPCRCFPAGILTAANHHDPRRADHDICLVPPETQTPQHTTVLRRRRPSCDTCCFRSITSQLRTDGQRVPVALWSMRRRRRHDHRAKMIRPPRRANGAERERPRAVVVRAAGPEWPAVAYVESSTAPPGTS